MLFHQTVIDREATIVVIIYVNLKIFSLWNLLGDFCCNRNGIKLGPARSTIDPIFSGRSGFDNQIGKSNWR